MCDETTWVALVEATWHLGDRLLVLTSPNLRGDDVADLQARLARLGFDCGRGDGIFGPKTLRALSDFQSNCGLRVDGICGSVTIKALLRVSAHTGTGPGVGAVREHERLRMAPASIASLRITVGQFGGLSIISRAVTRQLRIAGAHVMSLDEPDAVTHAHAANNFAADVYVGMEGANRTETVVYFYRVPTFESLGGRALAGALSHQLAASGLAVGAPCGMRLPVLRETRMPAVLCSFAPVRRVVAAAPAITEAVLMALAAWRRAPTLTH